MISGFQHGVILLGVGLGFCFGAVGLPWVLGEHSEEENRNEEREKRNEKRAKKVKIKLGKYYFNKNKDKIESNVGVKVAKVTLHM